MTKYHQSIHVGFWIEFQVIGSPIYLSAWWLVWRIYHLTWIDDQIWSPHLSQWSDFIITLELMARFRHSTRGSDQILSFYLDYLVNCDSILRVNWSSDFNTLEVLIKFHPLWSDFITLMMIKFHHFIWDDDCISSLNMSWWNAVTSVEVMFRFNYSSWEVMIRFHRFTWIDDSVSRRESSFTTGECLR